MINFGLCMRKLVIFVFVSADPSISIISVQYFEKQLTITRWKDNTYKYLYEYF